MGSWIVGVVSVLLGLVGLILAARAGDTYTYVAGLMTGGWSVVVVLNLITDAGDAP